jgi:hypothetical protein
MAVSLQKFSDSKDHLVSLRETSDPVLVRGVSYKNSSAAKVSLRSKFPQMISFSSGRVL